MSKLTRKSALLTAVCVTLAGLVAGSPLASASSDAGPAVAGGKAAPSTGSTASAQLDRLSFRLPSSSRVEAAADAAWKKLPDVPVKLWSAAVVRGDGKLYVAGGYGPGLARLQTLFAFDLSSRKWSKLADMPIARTGASAVWIDGKLHVSGGWSDDGLTSRTDVFDPADGKWSEGTEMPRPDAYRGTAVVGSRMYAVGGCEPGAVLCGSPKVHVYDAAENRWSEGPDYPEPVSQAACGAINDVVLCTGGSTGSSTLRSKSTYALEDGVWKKRADLPKPAGFGASSVADGKLLVSGGIAGEGDMPLPTNEGWIYDPATDQWADLPAAGNAYFGVGGGCGFYRVGGTTALMDDPGSDFEVLSGYDTCD